MRRLASLTVAAALAVGIAACGGDSTTVIQQTTVTESTASTPTTSAESPTTDETGPTYLRNVTGEQFEQPAEFTFSVDGDLSAADLSWSGWGSASASATGKFSFHDASSTRPVVIDGAMTVSDLTECQGAGYYTKLAFDLPSDAPFQPLTKNILTTPCD